MALGRSNLVVDAALSASTIRFLMHLIPSELRSETELGQASTFVGDQKGTLGVECNPFFLRNLLHYYSLFEQFKHDFFQFDNIGVSSALRISFLMV